ncbi:MAG: PEP-CTERM sorting domain-containing protein [Armatimonadota bacterium]|nr:PEP-CTERM sorting domain-containing protein [Armatimonadota bacterium]
MKKLKTLSFLLIVIAGVSANAQVVFYGGDADGRNGLIASTRPGDDGFSYDDFTLTQQTMITGLFGNFSLRDSPLYSTASWELRSGMSAGVPGTLLASGTGAATSIVTGRVVNLDPEFQVTVLGVNQLLSAGTYHMAMSLGNSSGRVFVNTTSGLDVVTGGDPNPAPTGGPLANGNTFFSSLFYAANAEPTTTYFGAGTWDFSYGVLGAVPEPSTFVAIGIALTGLVALRRRK